MTVNDAIEAGARALHDDTCGDDECGGLHGEDRDALTTARAMWPILSAPLRTDHRPVSMYEPEDFCPSTSAEHRDEHHREDVENGEWYCDTFLVGRVCWTCRDEDGDRIDWPCDVGALIEQTDKELGL